MDRAEPGSARFLRTLAIIVVLGLVWRVGYVLVVMRHDHDLYDSLYYELQARGIADGHGFFVDPFAAFRGSTLVRPAADHPPLTVLLLLPVALFHGPQLAMRFTMLILGVVTIALVGLVARELAGPRVGLVAAALAAADPNLWVNDGLIMSEAAGTLLTTALLGLCYLVLRRGPTRASILGLGVVAGLGMLTRAEFVLFVPFVVLPMLWVGSGRSLRAAVKPAVGVGLVIAVVIGPWVAFNLTRFERPTFISTNDGLALRAANCTQTYYGDHFGWVDVFEPCAVSSAEIEESVLAERNRSDAIHYISGHLSRLPVVVLARVGRAWNLFRIRQSMELGSGEGRPVWVSMLGALSTWLLAPAAVAGAVILRRRVRIWPMVAVIACVNAVLALVAGGLLRYRASAETSMLMLAAAAFVALWDRWRARPEPAA
jgi:4-amino-4-deoxy-L-arabinose transferase-like glycosyltransferase